MPLNCYLVEDSPIIRQNLIATLEELLPLQVVGTAEDEATALDWMGASAGRCDLMLIDIFLKSGTGLEVLRHAARRRPDSRLVVLTNYATPAMRQRCRQLGADRVFDKSAELDELLAYCGSLLPGHA
jgi:DNA-binding NarL/FixJ family response regulator